MKGNTLRAFKFKRHFLPGQIRMPMDRELQALAKIARMRWTIQKEEMGLWKKKKMKRRSPVLALPHVFHLLNGRYAFCLVGM